MSDICNLIGQKCAHISDIFYFYPANINGIYSMQNRDVKKIRLANKKIEKNSKQSKPSSVITYNIYNI